MNFFKYCAKLRFGQGTVLTRLQITERELPLLHAPQARDGQLCTLAEPADLPVAALVDCDAEKRGRAGFVQKLHSSGRSLAAVDFDGLRKRLLLPCYVPADPDEIGLVDALFRVHEGVCQHAVVRHEQKALGVIIQPPDRIHALRYVRDELRDGTPALFIVHGGHEAAWLAEHEIDWLRLLPRFDACAIQLDHVLLCVGLLAKLRGVAVDADAARRNQLLRPAARDACAARQNFLQSFFHTILLFCG